MSSSPRHRAAVNTGNLFYQHRLAQSLLRDMSYNDAVHWCQEYGWEGVLRVLLAKQGVLGRGENDGP